MTELAHAFAVIGLLLFTVRHDDKRRELDVYERLRGGGWG